MPWQVQLSACFGVGAAICIVFGDTGWVMGWDYAAGRWAYPGMMGMIVTHPLIRHGIF